MAKTTASSACSSPSVLAEAYSLAHNLGGSIAPQHVGEAVTSYTKYHNAFGGDEELRKSNYADLSNKYYDLVTSFYEFGWGESFHFASRHHGETFRESIKRHEHFLALKLGLQPSMKVLDVGCGIGGPLLEIAKFSGASITGLNNNDYQIKRGLEMIKKARLEQSCNFLKADFMDIPMPDNTYDAIYTIEACCHAPNMVQILTFECTLRTDLVTHCGKPLTVLHDVIKVKLHKELKRVLKPGHLLAGFDWCLTKSYDPSTSIHRCVKEEIELGNGLPDLLTTTQYHDALKEAGFEVLLAEDLAETSEVSWYEQLNPNRLSISGFRTTSLGRLLTRHLVRFLEITGIAPKGSIEVSALLERSGDALVAGGRLEIFTPMYFFLVRKPHE